MLGRQTAVCVNRTLCVRRRDAQGMLSAWEGGHSGCDVRASVLSSCVNKVDRSEWR